MITQEDITNGIKGVEMTTTGICETGDVYMSVRKHTFTPSGKTKVRNTYYLNGVKVVNYQRWTVEEWLINRDNIDTLEFKEIKLF